MVLSKMVALIRSGLANFVIELVLGKQRLRVAANGQRYQASCPLNLTNTGLSLL